MIRFTQPSDSVHKGRDVWFNPQDVMLIFRADRCYQCVVSLRNGDQFVLEVSAEEAAKRINRALREGK